MASTDGIWMPIAKDSVSNSHWRSVKNVDEISSKNSLNFFFHKSFSEELCRSGISDSNAANSKRRKRIESIEEEYRGKVLRKNIEEEHHGRKRNKNDDKKIKSNL